MLAPALERRRFQVVLIKPSHYDDDGYVVQWLRSAIPSNSLAVVYSLAADAAARQALGPAVEITISAVDECNTRIRPEKIIKEFRKNGFFGLVGLVGVQSNQFPRALDIARPLRDAGIPVVIGGFHVSGCLAMLPELQEDLRDALDIGVTLFAGELEGRIDAILNDASSGQLKPIYNFLNDLPGLDDLPPPVLPSGIVRRTVGHHTSFDAGRGCPFQCSFCTIINVQGRKSRRRSPDDVEQLIRLNWEQGIRHFVITDDNFARNKDWEPILDRIIKLRELDKLKIKLIIQVDTLCHRLPNFIEKPARAGVTRVFIGLENINPDNLMAAKKRQNKITEYRKMLLAWKEPGVITYAGYILGFPADTPESIRADIEIIKRELPLDILEFFCLTPLPGSEDHKTLHTAGVAMDRDMNKYDLEHVVTGHVRMSKEEWASIYHAAWDAYYTPDHLFTILRRAAAKRVSLSRLVAVLFFFAVCVKIEGVHPLQGGVVRLRFRTDRRPGLPIESFWSFWPKAIWRGFAANGRLFTHWVKLERIRRLIQSDPNRLAYMDAALAPVVDDEEERLEMFTHNEGARHAVVHARKIAALTHRENATAVA
jgi:radical SAM superfamily enzyme YgiQ (UPF0313 family)